MPETVSLTAAQARAIGEYAEHGGYVSYGEPLGEIEKRVLLAVIKAHRRWPRWGVTLDQVEHELPGTTRKQTRQALHRLTVKAFLVEQDRRGVGQGFRWWAPQDQAYRWLYLNHWL